MELIFPIEFLVSGTPVSFQSARSSSKSQWKQKVRAASDGSLPENHFACEGKLAVTLFYFPVGSVQGDVDNIVKLVLDALNQHIYMDDSQIERVVIQKFEPQRVFSFTQPSPVLAAALSAQKPILYVRLSDDPFEELA
ncbi:RusA family crossover junction endodeoxyribonuclease [Methylobacterium sp. WCS2018Hpa-22]|uniref:RusA family crossover junction endodeoxyribonuclease n=1 Tax=Methylobacterium sp. WCS2018Hpa-22 TaxID=3073633 RepID=UPI00288C1472|nr:RusA family crossover junction endodeoxyribonuclease [Methylobacterium sp. WCS2018Hpa-22]